MKIIRAPGYYQNGFVATTALGEHHDTDDT